MPARPPFTHQSTSYTGRTPPSQLSGRDEPYRDTIDFADEKRDPSVDHLEHAHPPYPHSRTSDEWTYGRLPAGAHGSQSPSGGGLGRALIIGWVCTTVLFLLATAFYKGQLFSALDRLSKDLQEMGYTGQAIFALLIFITTIPPLPLYSTLMVLSGYTFGTWDGFVISYTASLVGAFVVFVLARTFLKDCITKCLSSSPTSMSLLNLIPSKPHLLLLIRIAPYPYNLLNVILASSPGLTLKTYMSCTALSLLKVVLHAWFGAGVHDISELHRQPVKDDTDDMGRHDVKVLTTWGGLALCVGLFVYLHHVAKKALERAQAEVEGDRRAEEGQAMVHVSRA